MKEKLPEHVQEMFDENWSVENWGDEIHPVDVYEFLLRIFNAQEPDNDPWRMTAERSIKQVRENERTGT